MLLAQHQSWRPSRAVFKQALALFAVHWKSVALLLVGQVALVLLCAAAALVLAQPSWTQTFALGLCSALIFVYQLAMAACLIHLVADARPRPIAQMFRQSVLLKLPAMFVLALVVAAVSFVATLAFIIPGLIIAVSWSMAMFILVVEDVPVRAALRRSRDLVRGWWWPMFSRFLFLFTLLTLQTMIGFVPAVGPIVSALISIVLVPASIFYLYLTYKELLDVKQFKHLQAAQMHVAGKFLLACWAFLVFTVFVFVTFVSEILLNATIAGGMAA